jgi:COP9 signalosome complex subunit 6
MESVGLHPLVIFNIADHHTRAQLSPVSAASGTPVSAASSSRVIGAVFGQVVDRTVHVINSFELEYSIMHIDEYKDSIAFNEDTFLADTELYKSVFPNHEFLGWYSTGTVPSKSDLFAHQTLTKYNENPLYFVMNTNIPEGADELPISAYVVEVHFVDNQAVSEFVKVPYKVLTNEAERISIDHIAADVSASGEDTGSQMSLPLMSIVKALTSLESRVQTMHDYLTQFAEGKIEHDQSGQSDEILKQIKTVCNRLPTMDSDRFEREFAQEYCDGMLLTYLATLTKVQSGMKETISKFNVINESRRDRRMGGHGGGERGGRSERRMW